jgi:1-acyl-sn-glycerol-3-phosphate acyltransferase
MGNIPESGGAVVAANHVASGDTITMPSLFKRKIIFPGKKELFMKRGLIGHLLSWFLKSIGTVSLDRSGGRASAAGLAPLIQVLEDGGLVGIFPEGTRSPDGRLYRSHTGVARLALTAQVPVIPVGMKHTGITRGFLGIPSMKDARIIIGEPLDFSPWYGQENNTVTLRWVTDEIARAIQVLTGQQYVNVYASKVKHAEMTPEEVNAHVLTHPNDGVDVPLTKAERQLNPTTVPPGEPADAN